MADGKKPPARLEEISHLFLSGAPAVKPPAPAVKPPKLSTEPTGAAAARPNSALLFCATANFDAEKSDLAGHLALELARRNFAVALLDTWQPPASLLATARLSGGGPPPSVAAPVKIDRHSLRITEFSGRARQGLKTVSLNNGLDHEDPWAAISRLQHDSDFLVINAPADIFSCRQVIERLDPFFIFATTLWTEQILRSYALIKKVAQGLPCRQIGLLIMEDGFSRQAEAGFRVIAEMAQKFIARQISYVGTVPKGAVGRRGPLFMEGRNSPLSFSIRKIADNLLQDKNLPPDARRQ